jgi:hypothetical protein
MLGYANANLLLRQYGLSGRVVYIEALQETVSSLERRFIYYIRTDEDTQWICRLTHEKNFSMQLIEQQSQFAMMLYGNGVITPWKATAKGKYCIHISIDGFLYFVTIESFMEGKTPELSCKLFFDFGKLIGKTHALSEQFPSPIHYSVVRRALSEGGASFSRLLAQSPTQIPQTPETNYAGIIHDTLVENLSKQWELLPSGATQADLDIFNNLLMTESGLGIIDYNLAGEEVFLADALISYFSSIHHYNKRKALEHLDKKKSFEQFMLGYLSERSLNKFERKLFPQIAALFDGLYFCKELINEWNDGQSDYVIKHFEDSIQYFDPISHKLPGLEGRNDGGQTTIFPLFH